MSETSRLDEERIAALVRLLPPAPPAWVTAAQELPAARAELDTLVARAEADAEFRRQLVADLDAALEAVGVEPRPALVRALRSRMDAFQ
jgi:hypothetical protein